MTRYGYHHGFLDSTEHEFRRFGLVHNYSYAPHDLDPDHHACRNATGPPGGTRGLLEIG
jgi:hypothetical protein